MSDKFSYHRHLKTIADKDVEYLLWKDKQYGASWKESGRSAWFMVKRMIDRLTNMMARPPAPQSFNIVNVNNLAKDVEGASHLTNVPETGMFVCGLGGGTPEAMADHLKHLIACHLSEDLLAKVQAEGLEGPDGTVLAVLRDLRRYCLLVEAEITERLTKKSKTGTVISKEAPPAGWPLYTTGEIAGSGGGGGGGVPLEDSNKHALRYASGEAKIGDVRSTGMSEKAEGIANEMRGIAWPWAINKEMIKERKLDERPKEFEFWWEQRTPTRWILKPFVKDGSFMLMNGELFKSGVYRAAPSGCILFIEKCPAHLRDLFPRFCIELNHKELNELPLWARPMYAWNEGQDKFIVLQQYEAWTAARG